MSIFKKKKPYDVGVYGLWYGHNYGSIATYYALSKVLESMKLSCVMIRNPIGREIDIDSLANSHPLKFAREQYEVTPLYKLDEMYKLNDLCESFLIGSDQMWYYNLSRPNGQSYFLDFVDYNTNKIAYGSSFGRDQYTGPDEERAKVNRNLRRFNAISVRDDFSQRICKDDFGLDVDLVYDPVFLCPVKKYDELVKQATITENNTPFIFAYILDPNKEIGNTLKRVSQESGKRIVVIFDQSRYNPAHDINEMLGGMGITADDNITALDDPTIKDWLYCYKYATEVLTDSFHGSCFSIIYKKNFIVLKNKGRGASRFPFLLGGLGLIDRMVETPAEMADKFIDMQKSGKMDIDYTAVYNILDVKRGESMEWLKNALKHPKKLGPESELPQIPVDISKLNPDIQRCIMVASMIRDYGIKHIVVSSGARDVSLTRIFEANSCFVTHNVTDERSAAYYALGLATRLKEPVAITCTSGTAVSNYLPGITEAYHMQVPIAVISGDRYPYFAGQMEAQKIDHMGALASVVKASADLPIGWDGMIQWATRRMISDTLLEMTHHGAGPVHINVPMNFLENKFPPAETLQLSKYRHIDRVEIASPAQVWDNTIAKLKKAKRILVIVGQNMPMDPEEKKNFDRFCSSYNCCVVTDHLSNLENEYSLNPFNLLRKTGNNFFIQNLMPDLVLYFGGKRVLNCPLQGKMRGIPRKFEFWRIDPDGKVADLYRTLTHVYEMPTDYFFKYCADRADGSKNDKNYYNVWKKNVDDYPQVDYKTVEGFNSFYTIGKTMSVMPKNSLLHLGVGTSFNRAHFYDLDPSVDVYCNMGTNGIDGSASTFMGQVCASDENTLCFLFIGDLSFFYDMNSIWNKPMSGNIRILLNNDGGAGFLRHFNTPGITQAHNAIAKGWVESLGFEYLSASNRAEFDKNVKRFVSNENKPMFMEAFIE